MSSSNPLFLGEYESGRQYPNPMRTGKKNTTGTNKGYKVIASDYDKNLYPAYGLTRGNVAWLSEEDGPYKYKKEGSIRVDFNYYKSQLDDYNKKVKKYNEDALEYSGLA